MSTRYQRRGRRPFGTPNSRGAYATSSSLTPDRELTEGLKSIPVKTLSVPVLDRTDKPVEITDLEYIGSYNWVESSEGPTILVPGSPPVWQDKATPYQVSGDTGLFFVDQNGYRMGINSLLPLITAVEIHAEEEGNPPFEWNSVDIVTDRNGLCNLLRWIGGNQDAREFRIDLQLAGRKTVLFNRWEKKTREKGSSYTYGNNFEKASTHPAEGCPGSTGHYRIVYYNIGGLRMVVRFGVDACVQTKKTTRDPRGSPDISSTPDDLVNTLSRASLTSTKPENITTIPFGKKKLTVNRAGAVVPQSSIVELTTVSKKRFDNDSFHWEEKFPQLYLSQIPQHFLGVHLHGRFLQIQKTELSSPELKSKQVILQPKLQKLVCVLRLIKDMVIEHGDRGKLSIVFRNGEMNVFERSSDEEFLPATYVQKFAA